MSRKMHSKQAPQGSRANGVGDGLSRYRTQDAHDQRIRAMNAGIAQAMHRGAR